MININWRIQFSKKAVHDFDKLDKPVQEKINKFLLELMEKYENSRKIGKPLNGDLEEFWRYRIGDYRIITSIQDTIMTVLIMRVSHRKDIYDL